MTILIHHLRLCSYAYWGIIVLDVSAHIRIIMYIGIASTLPIMVWHARSSEYKMHL